MHLLTIPYTFTLNEIIDLLMEDHACNFAISKLWFKVSNAFERSISMAVQYLCSSSNIFQFSMRDKKGFRETPESLSVLPLHTKSSQILIRVPLSHLTGFGMKVYCLC